MIINTLNHTFLKSTQFRHRALVLVIAIAVLSLAYSFASRIAFSASDGAREDTVTPPTEAATKPPASTIARAVDDYGKLPIAFEANEGQVAVDTRFVARGRGYALYLTATGSVLTLTTPVRADGPTENDKQSFKQTTVSMRLKDSQLARVSGVDELPGKVNYFIGADPKQWRTNISTFRQVKYESVYPGIDLVYYGNQQQLEYDFTVAPGANPNTIRLQLEGARRARINARGDLVLSTEGGEVTWKKPISYQYINGRKRLVASEYVVHRRNEFGFRLGRYDKRVPLVIDPVLLYSTYFGGTLDDQGNGIAVDASANAYVVGTTSSVAIPLVAPFQATKGAVQDVFVTKINSTGSAIVYSTFLGGNGSDLGTAIAVDSAGNAYITGQTGSGSFPRVNPLQQNSAGSFDAFVTKLDSTGSALVYSTFLGGQASDIGNGIAVDSSGNAVVTGSTQSRNFPAANPIQTNRAGNAIFKTTNAAGNWDVSDVGLPSSIVSHVTFDPINSSTLYAAADNGVFRSTDSGATWTVFGNVPPASANRVAIDPTNPAIVYVAANGGMFKTVNGGGSFSPINNGLNSNLIRTVAIDPTNPNRLYNSDFLGFVNKTVDGGNNWTSTSIPSVSTIFVFGVEPVSGAVYAGTNRGVFKSPDNGTTWLNVNNGVPLTSVTGITFDSTNNVYLATGAGILKTTSAGAVWTNISSSGGFGGVSQVAVNPTNDLVIYAAATTGLFKSVDGGSSWVAAGNGYPGTVVNSLAIDPTNPSILYIGTSSGADAFVTKLSSSGNATVYSTYLGGFANDAASAVAIDLNGNAYVTGSTVSTDFPTANAIQPAKGLNSDAFVTKIGPAGSSITYSTFLGGALNDAGRGIAVDSSGNVYVAGVTNSSDFPSVNPFQATIGSTSINDGFVSKINASGSSLLYSSYLGGSSDDQCFALAVDGAGQALLIGTTSSFNFPIVNLPSIRSGPSDVFLTRVGSSGSALNLSGFFGGAGSDIGRGIAVDAADSIYVTGSTNSPNFPLASPVQGGFQGFTDAFIAKFVSAVELEVTISDSPDPVLLGSNLTYTISVKNNGELTGTGISLTHALPAGATFVSSNSTVGSCSGSGPVVCNIGTLAPNATAVVTVVITPPATRSISSTATVTLNENDHIPENNSATADTTVDFSDLSVVKKATASQVTPGSKVTYVINVKNNSGAAASQATLTDTLPSGVTFVSCHILGINGTCSAQGPVITATFFTLGPGNSDSVFLTVQLNNAVSAGTVVNNTAVIAGSLPDPNTQNNSSTVAITAVTNPIVQKSNGKIAFASDRFSSPPNPLDGIYLVNPDGTGEMFLPNSHVEARLPSWSRDGNRLAYTRTDFSGSTPKLEIYAIGSDGTGVTKLATDASDFNRGISWSPNGDYVAYVGRSDFGQFMRTVFIAGTDGSGSSPLPNSPNTLTSVDWSPDGTKFVYSTDNAIFWMNVDATQQTQLTTPQQTTDGPTSDFYPRWSPDGTKILFTRSTNNFRLLYVMNADGTAQTQLFNMPGDEGDWSPDGQAILFTFLNEIYRVNFDGTNLQQLTDDDFTDSTPEWQPLANPNPTPTPTPAPSFSLSGRVTGGSPQGHILVRLSGPVTAVAGGNGTGDYNFIRLPAGQYTVTPESENHSFNPPSRSITISNADVTNVDFAATFIPPNIRGRITDLNGQPIPNIRISAFGSVPLNDTFSDNNGFYEFSNEIEGQFYIIIPDEAGSSSYRFEPPSFGVQFLRGERVIDFVGTPKPANRISGQIREALTGEALPGLQVNLSQNGSVISSTTTGSGGVFGFGLWPANQSYTVSIPFTATYTFEPSIAGPPPIGQRVIQNLTTDQSLLFTASRRNAVQFAVTATSVSEGVGQAQISVTRSGDTINPATVNFGTIDDPAAIRCDVLNGTAYARCDYSTRVDTVQFAAGETSKTFAISLVDDGFAEANETFSIALSSPIGATLGNQTSIVVTINDNDGANGANPIFATPFFVRQHYLDFLSREPDAAGAQSWMNLLNNCSDVNNNPVCDRVTVSGSFFGSQEFQLKGYYVFRFYRLAFDRLPSYAELIPEMSAVTGQFESEVFQKKAAFAEAFAARPEFVNTYGSMTNEQFVNALMARYGLSQITTPDWVFPDGPGKITITTAFMISSLNSAGGMTRAKALRAIADSDEVFGIEFNRAFVAMQYYGYLRRTPETAGFNAWLNYLNANPTDFRTMVNGFMNSTEYRLRFGPTN